MQHRSRKFTLLLFVALGGGFLAGVFAYWRQVRRDAEVVECLRSRAVSLRTVDPRADLSDLAPLGAMIGDAQIVGAGEATHGTREHYLYKHRLLRFLVIEKGFRAIAFESPWPTGLALNEYVLNGKGDPQRLLAKAVFGVWYTQEVLDMVTWMRQYNAGVAPQQRIEFLGIDIQLTRDAARTVGRYLDHVDAEFRHRHALTLELLAENEMEGLYLDVRRDEVRARNTIQTRTVSRVVREILARFDAERSNYIAASSASEFEIVRQHARILVQQADACEDANPHDRDRFMADNVDWYLRQHPGRKIMVWAHNGHVAFIPSPKKPDLGRHLKDRHGDAYLSIGFVLGSGSYRAGDWRESAPTPAPSATFRFETGSRTFNALMKATGLKLFAVDLREARRSKDSPLNRVFRWREGYGVVTKIGDPLATVKRSPPATHDLLVFIDPTTPARPIPRS